MPANLITYLFSGFGFLLAFMAAAACIDNFYGYAERKRTTAVAAFLGLCSIGFNFYNFSVNAAPVFNMNFLLLIAIALVFDNDVLLPFAPFYLIGTYFSPFSVWFAAAALLAAFVAGLVKSRKHYKAVILVMTVIPLAFLEILVYSYLDIYYASILLSVASGAALLFVLLLGIVSLMIQRNFMWAMFIRTYFTSIFSKLDTLYTFRIDRGKNAVSLSPKCARDLEFESENPSFLSFEKRLFDSSNGNFKAINKRLDRSLFITASTGRIRYVEYACYRTLTGYRGLIHDITDQIPRSELLEKMSVRDYVTNFPSYPVMKEKMLQLAQRSSHLILFASIEVELEFLRHSIYEIEFEILCFRYLASLLKKVFPSADFYSIKNGELFMALPGVIDNAKAVSAVARLKSLLKNPYKIGDRSITFHAQIGAYVTESSSIRSFNEGNEVINKLSFCKYMVRRQKENNVYLFSQKTYESYLLKQTRIKHLPHIIEHGEADLVYQPVISLKTGKAEFYEVLLRVRSEFYKNTIDFIMDCISEGRDIELDRMVFGKVLQNVRAGKVKTNISINILSNTPICDELKEIARLLRENGHTLYIEITEHMANEMTNLKYKAVEINKCGAKLVVDDFGIGYSNNRMLGNTNFDVLKIPRELIDNIATDKKAECMIKSIIEYCRGVDVLCIIEGIETDVELEKIRSLSADYGQGYYLQKPLTELPSDEDIKFSAALKDPEQEKAETYYAAQKNVSSSKNIRQVKPRGSRKFVKIKRDQPSRQ